MSSNASLEVTQSSNSISIIGVGAWTAPNIGQIEKAIDEFGKPERPIVIDMSAITEMDTFGAWALETLLRSVLPLRDATLVGLPLRFAALRERVHATNQQQVLTMRVGRVRQWSDRAAHSAEEFMKDVVLYLNMAGAICLALIECIAMRRRFRPTSIVRQIDRVGLTAIPIIVLITLLVGAIIAQQGVFHFRKFGADDYVVDLVGILVLRELGVLIVAIMVAGRSGSSYTAELGSMKMREEIDALRTMGRDPVDILLLPRVIALVVALPLLTFVGSLSALIGGGLIAWLYGGMDPSIFMSRLKDAVAIADLEVGMIKAPFMAAIIGIVACVEGLKVKGSAESLGLQTTTSVVKSIFLVIVMDGFFAIFFSSIGM